MRVNGEICSSFAPCSWLVDNLMLLGLSIIGKLIQLPVDIGLLQCWYFMILEPAVGSLFWGWTVSTSAWGFLESPVGSSILKDGSGKSLVGTTPVQGTSANREATLQCKNAAERAAGEVLKHEAKSLGSISNKKENTMKKNKEMQVQLTQLTFWNTFTSHFPKITGV